MRTTQSLLAEWLLRTTNPSGAQSLAETKIAIGTEVGLTRGENQDKVAGFAFECLGEPALLAVISDGMGGLQDGEVCAALAIAGLLSSCVSSRAKNAPAILTQAAHAANQAVFELYGGSGGATLSAVLCFRDHVVGLNIGDSRIYQLSGGKLKQMSTDDTLAGQLDRKEEAGAAELGLLQFIGCGSDLTPHILEIGDPDQGLLLTSDGVHYLPQSVTTNIAKLAPSAITAVRRMLAVSKWCSGHDNGSAVYIPHHFELQDINQPGLARVWDSFGELSFFVGPEAQLGKAQGQKFSFDDTGKSKAFKADKQNRKEKGKPKSKSRSSSKKAKSTDVAPELHVDLFEEGGE